MGDTLIRKDFPAVHELFILAASILSQSVSLLALASRPLLNADMVTSLICNKNSHLLLFIALPAAVNSFLTTSGVLSTLNLITANRQPFKIPCSASYRAYANNDTDIEEDEIEIKPYRNRSLAWTLRYRRLNPYERARARVISFGHRSKEDWDEAVSSGQLGQYVPNYPDEMYAPEWDR